MMPLLVAAHVSRVNYPALFCVVATPVLLILLGRGCWLAWAHIHKSQPDYRKKKR